MLKCKFKLHDYKEFGYSHGEIRQCQRCWKAAFIPAHFFIGYDMKKVGREIAVVRHDVAESNRSIREKKGPTFKMERVGSQTRWIEQFIAL